MRTSLTLAALGASAALAPTALALSYQTGHFKRSNHPALAERALAQAAAAAPAHLDKRAEPAANSNQSNSLARRQRFERKVRRGESSSSSSSAKAAVYESTAIWWATTGWAATCGEATRCVLPPARPCPRRHSRRN